MNKALGLLELAIFRAAHMPRVEPGTQPARFTYLANENSPRDATNARGPDPSGEDADEHTAQ